jgi:hypothetical protein
MSKVFTTAKLAVATGAVLASTLFMSFGVATAATATTSVVPNTNTCYAGTPVTSTYDTSYGNNSTFVATWNDDNTFTVTAAKPLTKKVQLFVSDYFLTSAAYKGGCFSRDVTAGTTPQTWNATQTYTLAKGWTGTQTLSVALPTTCANVQVDLYTGKVDSTQGIVPLNGTVDSNGHDAYGYIAGNIMMTAKNPACAPTTPVTPVVPVTPTTPQVLAASTTAPAQLSDTGLNIWVTSLLAVATIAGAVFVARKRDFHKFDDISI